MNQFVNIVVTRCNCKPLIKYVNAICGREIYPILLIYRWHGTKHITLEVNCGFSRTDTSNRNKGSHNDSDAQNRALEFQNLFKDCPKYFQNGSYFDSCGYNGSQFDRDCKSVLLHFHKK